METDGGESGPREAEDRPEKPRRGDPREESAALGTESELTARGQCRDLEQEDMEPAGVPGSESRRATRNRAKGVDGSYLQEVAPVTGPGSQNPRATGVRSKGSRQEEEDLGSASENKTRALGKEGGTSVVRAVRPRFRKGEAADRSALLASESENPSLRRTRRSNKEPAVSDQEVAEGSGPVEKREAAARRTPARRSTRRRKASEEEGSISAETEPEKVSKGPALSEDTTQGRKSKRKEETLTEDDKKEIGENALDREVDARAETDESADAKIGEEREPPAERTDRGALKSASGICTPGRPEQLQAPEELPNTQRVVEEQEEKENTGHTEAPGKGPGKRQSAEGQPEQPKPSCGVMWSQDTAPLEKRQRTESNGGVLRTESLLFIPKGKPKSGRIWKDQNKKRFTHMMKDKPLHSSWEKKIKEREERRMVKGLARQLQEQKQQEKEEKRRRREENLKRRLENERKSEIVQVIKNPSKIKRMKKKQLRRIEKRDTLKATLHRPDQGHTSKKSSGKE